MKNTNARRWIVLSGVLCVMLVLNAVVAYRNITGIIATHGLIARAHEVREALDGLRHAFALDEAAARGYALTGDGRFLSEHAQALRDLHTGLIRVRQLTRDSPEQQTLLNALENHAMKATAWFSRVIRVRSDSGSEGAQRVVATGTGAPHAAAFRASLDAMEVREAALSGPGIKTRSSAFARR